jgi:hypothetical protein
MPTNRKPPMKSKPPAPKPQKPAAASLANIYSEFNMGGKGASPKPRKGTAARRAPVQSMAPAPVRRPRFRGGYREMD